MIWLWLIFSSALFAESGTFRGHVQLKDSRDPAVRKRAEYSGVVVSLRPLDPQRIAALHQATPPKHYEILQIDKMFRPHLLAVETGSIIDFPNADPIFHNAFSSYNGQVFDVGLYPPGSSRSVRFSRPGVVRVFCNIHSSMSAVIVVLGTPYFAVTGADGAFALNAPVGEYKCSFYHERATEETLRALTGNIQIAPAQASTQETPQPNIVISEAGYLPSPHKNKHGQDYPPKTDDRAVYPGVRK